MKWTLLLVTVFAVHTSARADVEPHKPAEIALLIAAEALLAVDTFQTFSIKNRCWRANIWVQEGVTHSECVEAMHEINPFMGKHPSDARILVSGVLAGAALAVGWYYLPRPWRNVLPGAVVAIEVPNTIRNHALGLRMTVPF
jgi:hypothetical protein